MYDMYDVFIKYVCGLQVTIVGEVFFISIEIFFAPPDGWTRMRLIDFVPPPTTIITITSREYFELNTG